MKIVDQTLHIKAVKTSAMMYSNTMVRLTVCVYWARCWVASWWTVGLARVQIVPVLLKKCRPGAEGPTKI